MGKVDEGSQDNMDSTQHSTGNNTPIRSEQNTGLDNSNEQIPPKFKNDGRIDMFVCQE